MVSVANPGLDANWCGHHFSQANWYASGRLAWNHELPAAQIAEEWTRMTFTNDTKTVATIREMMMTSREAFVNYTMPLGLHHLIGGNHYAPMPQNDKAPRATGPRRTIIRRRPTAIGFDRTMRGNQAVGPVFPAGPRPVRQPRDLSGGVPALVPSLRVGLQAEIRQDAVERHSARSTTQGAEQAAAMQTTWQSLAGRIDAQRHKEVADRLAIQVADAATWRDQILQYFQGFSKRPIVAR